MGDIDRVYTSEKRHVAIIKKKGSFENVVVDALSCKRQGFQLAVLR